MLIKEHVHNEAVSNMLINRIREKSSDKPPPSSSLISKNTQLPQSAGLKYLNKVASQQQHRYSNNQDLITDNLENKDPLINVQR